MSTINIIGLGGCGTNVAIHVAKKLRANHVLPDIYTHRLYSSDDALDFTFDTECRFKTAGINQQKLTGSGGDRGSNLNEYVKGIRDYLDDPKIFSMLKKAKDGIGINMLFFSGTKGTGSTSGPIMMKMLTEQDIPFVAFMVTDNRDELSIINNVNTLKSIDAIARQTKSNPLVYIGENSAGNIKRSEQEVNDDIGNIAELMAIMGAGLVNELDESDYNSFIDCRKYKSLDIPISPMILQVLPKDEHGNIETMQEGLTPVLARIVMPDNETVPPTISAKHAPHGYINQDNVTLELEAVVTSNIGLQAYVNRLEDAFVENAKQLEVTNVTSKIDELINRNKPVSNYQDEIKENIRHTTFEDSDDEDGWVKGFI